MDFFKRLPAIFLLLVCGHVFAQDPYTRYEDLFRQNLEADVQTTELAGILTEHTDFYPAYLSLTGIFIENGKSAEELDRFILAEIGDHPFIRPVLLSIYHRDRGEREAAIGWAAKATKIPPSPFLVSMLLKMNPDRAAEILGESGVEENLSTILRMLYVERTAFTRCEQQIRERFAAIEQETDPQRIIMDAFNYLLLLSELRNPPEHQLAVWHESPASKITETHPVFVPIAGQILFRLHEDLLDYHNSRTVITESLRLARQYHYRRLTMLNSRWLADLESREGRIPEAIAILKQELAYVRQSGNPLDLVNTLNMLGKFYRMAGLSEQSIPFLEEGLLVAEEHEPRKVAHMMTRLANACLSSGQVDRAESLARSALEEAIKTNQPSRQTGARHALASALYRKGDLEGGLKIAQQLKADAAASRTPNEMTMALSALSEGFLLSDDPCRAIEPLLQLAELNDNARSNFYAHFQIYRAYAELDCPQHVPWPFGVFKRLSHIRKAVRESDKVNVNAFETLAERYEFVSNTVQAHRFHAEAMGEVARTVATIAGAILVIWALFFGIHSLLQWRSKNLIGPYQIREQVGEGGMGDVFRAVSMENRQVVALKILKIPVTGSPHKIKRFKDEIKILSRLDHPNILQYYDSGEHRGRLYLATEFLDGETLENKLDREWPLPMELGLFITGEILEGLSYLHEKAVLHRDIKPGNIMVADLKFSLTHPTGRMGRMVKLMDFGIAKEIGTDSQTQGLEVVGTPAYIAPESLTMSVSSEQTDIYSFGVTLYRMFTGVLPYQHPEPMVVQHQILNPDVVPPRPSHVVKELPQALDMFIMNCLAKAPRQRYQNIADTKAAFAAMKDQLDS